MLGSLRFRLPALFLLGIVLAAVVATLIAVRFFQSNTRAAAASELRNTSAGIVQLYELKAGVGHVSVASLNLLLGGNKTVFWVPAVSGGSLLAGPLQELPSSALPAKALADGKLRAFDLHVHGSSYLGVAQEVTLGSVRAGALVVAEPESALRSRWLQLFWELALAFGIGIPVAGVLILYYSRRIARPLVELATAADEVAAGHYDVAVPERTWGSEVERLASRFHEMTARLVGVGTALSQLPDVGVTRAAHAADRDPRPRRRPAGGRLRGRGGAAAVARGGLGGGAEARTARRRRPRPRQARRTPVRAAARGGRHAGSLRARLRDLRRGGEGPRDRVRPRARGGSRADHRRRPGAADRHEPDRQRAALDAGGRARRPRPRDDRTAR